MYAYESIIQEIWSKSEGDYVFLPRKEFDAWKELPAKKLSVVRVEGFEVPDEIGHDSYFSVLRFNAPVRVEGNIGRPGVLFADLDRVRPAGLAPKPSVYWMTSPDSWQAVWYLDQPIEVSLFEQLNKALTEVTGADKGGWHRTKVLRLPGTLNWKRRTVLEGSGNALIPRGTNVTRNPGLVYSVEYMETVLLGKEIVSPVALVNTGYPPLHTLSDLRTDFTFAKLPMRLRSWLPKENVSDRSMFIWRAACAFAEAGIPPETAFAFMWIADWNKYRDRPQRLWMDIQRAYSLD